MQKSNYLIIGGNFINKGAEAMLLTAATQIRLSKPDAKIYAICHPEEKAIAKSFGIEPLTVERSAIQNVTRKVSRKVMRSLFDAKYPYADETPVDKLQTIDNLAGIVDVSGFAYHDGRGFQQPLETLKALDCFPKTPFYVMPQAWGPFSDPQTGQYTKMLLQRATQFYVRDRVSEKFVADLLGQNPESLSRMPDIAFSFGTLEDSQVTPALEAFVFDKNRGTTYGISPNMRIFEKGSANVMENEYGKLLVDLSLSLLAKGGNILLIPNEMRPGGEVIHPDDLKLCNQLYAVIKAQNDAITDSQLRCPAAYMSAYEVKYLIGQLDYLIASRFHSLIFGLSQEVPSIAISWSHKYKELFRLFDQVQYVVEEADMEHEKLLLLIEKLEKNSSAIKTQIHHRLPTLQEELNEVFSGLKNG